MKKLIYLPIVLASFNPDKFGVPTAIFHGLNDNCNNNKILTQNLSKATGNAYVKCIEIGSGTSTTWWKQLTLQAKEAC
jgi:hypothetical protein